jgi:hypothetical protein
MTKAKAGVRHRLYHGGPIIWLGSFISRISSTPGVLGSFYSPRKDTGMASLLLGSSYQRRVCAYAL